jgi:hypothetical protein
MKKVKYLTLIVLVLPSILKADVIYTPHKEFGTALSLELIGSYEFPFSKYNTINFWGGVGIVSMISELKHPGLGTEMAIEVRQYFKSNSFKNLNIGLYAGFAYMRHPYFYNDHLLGKNNSVGFVPGLKLTYKKRINSWLVGEPYVGVSVTWYDNNFKELFNWISRSDPGLVLTFGVRVGINKVKLRDQ